MHPKISYAKWRPFCPGGNGLTWIHHELCYCQNQIMSNRVCIFYGMCRNDDLRPGLFVVIILSVLSWSDRCDWFTGTRQGCFTVIGPIAWLYDCQWRGPVGYGYTAWAKPQQNTTQRKPCGWSGVVLYSIFLSDPFTANSTDNQNFEYHLIYKLICVIFSFILLAVYRYLTWWRHHIK